MSQILTDREAIREWATARGGNPMLMEVPEGSRSRTLLQLTFGQHAINADGNEGPDRVGGFELVDWDEWFAALEANNLSLMVSDDPSGGNEAEFSFVERGERSDTSGAA
ncbi:hypothetical protein SAMN06295905_3304 [Devosia lucknowensis]|uniref:Uncharacterized protein n=1 Tax=Devosia lucknowensis TaxID=1096929 RepID=A0A1Y6GB86_9HYPH|nr:hypothetical protein [Devosia lucknowensis]SMQ86008.1 hypothetical protein SAMN06295905_3304 [Devosia lucknowensis]